MAVKARQQYYADETSLKKEAREFWMLDALKDKLDSVEYWAQVNVIEEVQENWVPLEIVDKSVNVLVPEVIDNLYTIDPDNSLSAKQWKILYDMIKNLLARGRFLSTWNTATWLPMTNPTELPYEYKAWDYYIVWTVAAEGWTNFRPEPDEYDGTASDTPEPQEVHITDIYVYDWENWLLLINSTREIAVDDYVDYTFESTNPVENQAIAKEFVKKQNKFYTAWPNQPSSATSNEGDEWYDTAHDKLYVFDWTNWNEVGNWETYTAWLHISIDANNNNRINVVEWSATSSALWLVKLGSDTRQTTTPNSVTSTANRTYRIQTNSSWQLLVNVPWTDTTYTAWDWISIDTSNNNRISCTVKPVTVGPTAPANPGTWDLWYDTTKNTMFLYKNNAWTIIGPEIYPITKDDYEALTPAEQWDGRFFLITDNDWTIYVDWDNVQNRPVYAGDTAPLLPCEWYIWYDTANDVLKVYDWTQWNEVWWGWGCCYTAWNWIDISNDEISIDTTVVATQTDLATKQNIFHTTSSSAPSNPSEWDEWYDTTNDVLKVYDWSNWIVTGKTYTAWTNIDITNDVISADTQFVVVDTLPAVATADVNKVYILWPIWEWADKYEEYIVREVSWFTSSSPVNKVTWNWIVWEYGDKYQWSEHWFTNKYIWISNLYQEDTSTGEWYINIYDFDSSTQEQSTIVEHLRASDMPYTYSADALLDPIVVVNSDGSSGIDGSLDIYYSDSSMTWGTWKEWTKIWETSPDIDSKQDKATSGSWAPSTTPSYIGQMYVDTTNDNLYVATGTSSSSDWTAVDTNTTYTAWDRIDITNNVISADKQFEVVTVLPSASTASEDKVYILWPIWEWADKYEEWVVIDVQPHFESASPITHEFIETTYDWVPAHGTIWNEDNLIREKYLWISGLQMNGWEIWVTDGWWSCSCCSINSSTTMPWIWNGAECDDVNWYECPDMYWNSEYSSSWDSASFDLYYSDTALTWNAWWKTWIKIWETSQLNSYTAWDGIDITNNIISTDISAWTGINITWWTTCTTESDRKWPAPSWFHIPSKDEWEGLITMMGTFSLDYWEWAETYLHMPYTGYRQYYNSEPYDQRYYWMYWTSSYHSLNSAYYLAINSYTFEVQYTARAEWGSIRPFKNTFVAPTSSWTVLIWTLWSDWIFWDQTNGLISITSDWTTGYTIMDKNLWATTVYSHWDELSEANCGKYYQWWNNYWFAWTWNVATSYYTQVDVSSYWPDNYYSSSTFACGEDDWALVHNNNLWWDISNSTHQECTWTSELTISADTTVLATKQDIANLWSFTVVDTLPSVSSADEKTIYLLWPIGSGADKYEEWIVTNDWGTVDFTYANWSYTPNSITIPSNTTITSSNPQRPDWARNGDWVIVVWDYFFLETEDDPLWCWFTEIWVPAPGTTGKSMPITAWTYSVSAMAWVWEEMWPFESITLSYWAWKQWTKIWETSIDLTDYAQKSEVLTKTNTTSYTPSWDYNPATKKYVDDRAVPTSGTTWYILTKTANGYEWAAAPASWKNDIVTSASEPSDHTVLWIKDNSERHDDNELYYYNYEEGEWVKFDWIYNWSTEPDHFHLWYDSVEGMLKACDSRTSWNYVPIAMISYWQSASDGAALWIDEDDDYRLKYYDEDTNEWQAIRWPYIDGSAPYYPDFWTHWWLWVDTSWTYPVVKYYDAENGQWKPVWWVEYSAWDGIDINNWQISVDVTDIIWTWLTEDANNNIVVDTTVIATKQDIANLWSFTVVDTLPSVSSADEKTIYLLGPIWTGADKYEEWIVTGADVPGHFESSSEILESDWEEVSGSQIGTVWASWKYVWISWEPTTTQIAYTSYLFTNWTWYSYSRSSIPGENIWTFAWNHPTTFSVVKSSSALTWVEGTSKQWTKIWETSVDLSNYLAKDNTTSFTPSGDYNPATKKYVDDHSGKIDIISSTTQPSDDTVIWRDTTTDSNWYTFRFNDHNWWKEIEKLHYQSSAPSFYHDSDLWYDTTNDLLKYYDYNAQDWVPIVWAIADQYSPYTSFWRAWWLWYDTSTYQLMFASSFSSEGWYPVAGIHRWSSTPSYNDYAMGNLWYDSSDYKLKYYDYDYSDWLPIKWTFVDSSAPSGSDWIAFWLHWWLWYDTTNDVLKYYNWTAWVSAWGITYTAWDGIDIDTNNNNAISVDVTDIIGTWLSEDNNNNIIIDTTVVATQTDLSWKQDKATSGSTAPATTPSYVWQQYIDTTNDKMYVATGTSSSSDWTEVGAWSGDMLYADFNWATKTWASITLDLNSEIEPSANFTVNAPATIKDWQIYVLRVTTWATAYTMTLGTNVTNPYSEDLTLTANTIAQFSFVWIDNKLELQPSIEAVDMSNYLAKNNTTSFTPSGDYNPATKKYVDDNKGKNDIITSATAPSDTDAIWKYAYNNVSYYDEYRYYNGSEWVNIEGITYSSSAPYFSNNDYWRLWYDTNNYVLNYFDNNTWDWAPVWWIISSVWTWLSLSSGEISVDTTVIQPKLTASTWINISNDTISADTTVLATKADLADLWGFEVVSTLPSVSTADTKTIYLLGPIWTGADKYEEWIVTEEDNIVTFVWDWSNWYTPNSLTLSSATTFEENDFVIPQWEGWQIIFIDSNNNTVLYYDWSDLLDWNHTVVTSLELPAWIYSVWAWPSLSWSTVTLTAWTAKVWTKIWETSVDLSDLNVKAFPLSWTWSSASVLAQAQAIYDYYLSGKTPVIVYNGWAYIPNSINNMVCYFAKPCDIAEITNSNSTTQIYYRRLSFDRSWNTITEVHSANSNLINVLATGENYSTPYVPEYNGSPTTKKYVDDRDVYIWTSEPTSNKVEWRLWYDTTNDILKSYDWTQWNVVWNWDMAYADFNWVTKTWATVTLDINSTITPSANFTVNAPSTIKDWQIYILRVVSWATAYTMTLGTWITNPYSTSTTLTANYTDQFVFQAIGWSLELLPDTEVDISGKQDKATSWSSAPATTPTYVWQQYVNTSTTTPYIATWTSSSSDWQATPVLSKQYWAATNLKIWVWTQAAYEALSGSYDSNTLYFTTTSVANNDANEGGGDDESE